MSSSSRYDSYLRSNTELAPRPPATQTCPPSGAAIKSVQTDQWRPEIANAVPHLKVRWDQSQVKLTPQDVMKQLREGKPSIEASPATDKDNLVIAVWMLQPGEAEIITRRIRETLTQGA